MNPTVHAAIAYTLSAPSYPPGTVVSKITIALQSNTGGLSYSVDAAANADSADISNVAPDTYTVTCTAFDAGNNTLTTFGQVYTVSGDAPVNISLDLPSSLTLSQS